MTGSRYVLYGYSSGHTYMLHITDIRPSGCISCRYALALKDGHGASNSFKVSTVALFREQETGASNR